MVFKSIAILSALLALAGCAAPAVVASTPRSVTVAGAAVDAKAHQKAHDLAQAECQKHGRHASLLRAQGTRAEAAWQFDCIN